MAEQVFIAEILATLVELGDRIHAIKDYNGNGQIAGYRHSALVEARKLMVVGVRAHMTTEQLKVFCKVCKYVILSYCEPRGWFQTWKNYQSHGETLINLKQKAVGNTKPTKAEVEACAGPAEVDDNRKEMWVIIAGREAVTFEYIEGQTVEDIIAFCEKYSKPFFGHQIDKEDISCVYHTIIKTAYIPEPAIKMVEYSPYDFCDGCFGVGCSGE